MRSPRWPGVSRGFSRKRRRKNELARSIGVDCRIRRRGVRHPVSHKTKVKAGTLVDRVLSVLLAVLNDQVLENTLHPETARVIFLKSSRLLQLDIAEEIRAHGVAATARRLGVSRVTLYRWLRTKKGPLT
jgi:hypothetical protein